MDRGTQAVVIVTVVTALAGLFIFLRVISRFIVVQSPGAEDYTILLAMLTSIGLAVLVDLQRRNGLGRHSEDVSHEDNVRLLKLLYSSILVYNTGLAIVKASLLYQYLRFFVARKWRRACYGMFAIVVVGALAFLTTSACTCIPVSAFWDTDIRGSCINTQSKPPTHGPSSLTSCGLLVFFLGLQSDHRLGLLGFTIAGSCETQAAEEAEDLAHLRVYSGGLVRTQFSNLAATNRPQRLHHRRPAPLLPLPSIGFHRPHLRQRGSCDLVCN
jgi:hypothetical protein